MNVNKTVAPAGPGTSANSLTPAQIERLHFLTHQWHERLQRSTTCELFAPVKLVTRAIGGAVQSVRNRGNRISVEGREIQGLLIAGRVSFDLLEVAGAIAAAKVISESGSNLVNLAVEDDPVAKPVRGRRRKTGLSASGAAA